MVRVVGALGAAPGAGAGRETLARMFSRGLNPDPIPQVPSPPPPSPPRGVTSPVTPRGGNPLPFLRARALLSLSRGTRRRRRAMPHRLALPRAVWPAGGGDGGATRERRARVQQCRDVLGAADFNVDGGPWVYRCRTRTSPRRSLLTLAGCPGPPPAPAPRPHHS